MRTVLVQLHCPLIGFEFNLSLRSIALNDHKRPTAGGRNTQPKLSGCPRAWHHCRTTCFAAVRKPIIHYNLEHLLRRPRHARRILQVVQW